MSLKGVAFLIGITEGSASRFPPITQSTNISDAQIHLLIRILANQLIKLSKLIPNTHYYCPSFASCAYLVLHTDANVIFAIALGMLSIGFHLPAAVVIDAVANGDGKVSPIGDDWLSVSPFPRGLAASANDARLLQWCEAAHTYAVVATSGQ
jgi:hypothetical protein